MRRMSGCPRVARMGRMYQVSAGLQFNSALASITVGFGPSVVGGHRSVFFRPFGAGSCFSPFYPRLAPWAAFFRRFAAGPWVLLGLGVYLLGRSWSRFPPLLVTSVTAFAIRVNAQSVTAVLQPRSGGRVQPTPSGVGRPTEIGTSPEGAKENAAYVWKHPSASDFFYSGTTAVDQTGIPRGFVCLPWRDCP